MHEKIDAAIKHGECNGFPSCGICEEFDFCKKILYKIRGSKYFNNGVDNIYTMLDSLIGKKQIAQELKKYKIKYIVEKVK